MTSMWCEQLLSESQGSSRPTTSAWGQASARGQLCQRVPDGVWGARRGEPAPTSKLGLPSGQKTFAYSNQRPFPCTCLLCSFATAATKRCRARQLRQVGRKPCNLNPAFHRTCTTPSGSSSNTKPLATSARVWCSRANDLGGSVSRFWSNGQGPKS